ncbi:MAG: Clp protease N-terminal domain-containing protein, partial [Endomicrobiia bacterium]
MNLENFTIKSQESLLNAQRFAEKSNHTEFLPEHLLYTILISEENIVSDIIKKIGIEKRKIISDLELQLKSFPQAQYSHQTIVSPRLQKVINFALDIMTQLKDEYVSVEHLFIGIFDENGPAGKILQKYGLTKNIILETLKTVR